MAAPRHVLRLGFAPLIALVASTGHAAGRAAPDPYAEECGSCHIAYPAELLSKPDWNRVLGQLDRHFGVDASLDAATLRQVAQRLGATTPVASVQGKAPPLPRITAQPWFQREHREVAAAKFRSPAVKSAANCSACHAGAERGIFEDADEGEKEGHDHD